MIANLKSWANIDIHKYEDSYGYRYVYTNYRVALNSRYSWGMYQNVGPGIMIICPGKSNTDRTSAELYPVYQMEEVPVILSSCSTEVQDARTPASCHDTLILRQRHAEQEMQQFSERMREDLASLNQKTESLQGTVTWPHSSTFLCGPQRPHEA